MANRFTMSRTGETGVLWCRCRDQKGDSGTHGFEISAGAGIYYSRAGKEQRHGRPTAGPQQTGSEQAGPQQAGPQQAGPEQAVVLTTAGGSRRPTPLRQGQSTVVSTFLGLR